MEHAQTKPDHEMMVQVSGVSSSDPVTLLSAGDVTSAFDCRSVRVNPTDFARGYTVTASGSGVESWGWRALYLVNQFDFHTTSTPILDSFNGEPQGQNNFWIGIPSDVTVPGKALFFNMSATTSTTTATTTTATTTTATTTKTPMTATIAALPNVLASTDTQVNLPWHHLWLSVPTKS